MDLPLLSILIWLPILSGVLVLLIGSGERAQLGKLVALGASVLAFVLSTLIPGAVGAVYAMYTSFIDPNSVFSTAMNIQMIVIVMLGGTGTLWGPILGAVIVVTLREWLWASFPALHLLLMGVGIIVIVLFLPVGVLSLLRKRKSVRPEAVGAGEEAEP